MKCAGVLPAAALSLSALAESCAHDHVAADHSDGLELLKAADRMKLEGIVSKRRDAPCETWRKVNKERWRLFERRS